MVVSTTLAIPGFGVLSSKSSGVYKILGPWSRHCRKLVPKVSRVGDKKLERMSANQSKTPESVNKNIKFLSKLLKITLKSGKRKL